MFNPPKISVQSSPPHLPAGPAPQTPPTGEPPVLQQQPRAPQQLLPEPLPTYRPVPEAGPLAPAPQVPAPPVAVNPSEAPVITVPAPHFEVMLTSWVNAGATTLTIILCALIVGVWYFGNRVASQLISGREQNG